MSLNLHPSCMDLWGFSTVFRREVIYIRIALRNEYSFIIIFVFPCQFLVIYVIKQHFILPYTILKSWLPLRVDFSPQFFKEVAPHCIFFSERIFLCLATCKKNILHNTKQIIQVGTAFISRKPGILWFSFLCQHHK